MVPTFSDWQIFPTFPVSFFFIFQYFFSVLFHKFNKYKNLVNKYTSIKNQRKNKHKKWLKFSHFPVFWVKFPHISSILVKIPRLSSLFKIPWLENVFLFFQVFQSMWEPCLCDWTQCRHEHKNQAGQLLLFIQRFQQRHKVLNEICSSFSVFNFTLLDGLVTGSQVLQYTGNFLQREVSSD